MVSGKQQVSKDKQLTKTVDNESIVQKEPILSDSLSKLFQNPIPVSKSFTRDVNKDKTKKEDVDTRNASIKGVVPSTKSGVSTMTVAKAMEFPEGAARRLAFKQCKKTLKLNNKKKVAGISVSGGVSGVGGGGGGVGSVGSVGDSVVGDSGGSSSDPMRVYRVMFVGGVPLNTNTLEIRDFFEIEKSDVESIYFRSLPVSTKWTRNKRTGAILKDYSDSSKATKNAYIVLSRDDPQLKKKILQKNMELFDGVRIRVDYASNGDSFSKFDPKRTVFVGQLSRSVDETELYDAFSNVGEIKSVRIVRDKETCGSKGFGFVFFSDRLHVKKSLQTHNGVLIKGRPAFVCPCLKENDPNMPKKAAETHTHTQRTTGGGKHTHTHTHTHIHTPTCFSVTELTNVTNTR
eukprot:GHVR01012517.1.p1 GENE.GHVR01012517.1~~GHVR01012517.1.p1  ORF type:complete len:403 (+),score=145.76 GHVR01012517.1:51-1259(+)